MELRGPGSRNWRTTQAYTLVEVVVAVFVLGIMVVSLFGGFSSGFAVVRLARENLRATQVMVQRLEDTRAYSWGQVTNSTVFKPVFLEYYNPPGTNTGTSGASYQGLVAVAAPPGIPAAYSNNMRSVTVTLYWTNYVNGPGNKPIVHTRQMQTYVARYGMQHYVAK